MHLTYRDTKPSVAPDIANVEVTPEMIVAGMEEYSARWLGLRDANDAIAEEMLRAAFLAMNSARRG
jgi:hypothetical protein